jgi:hypothetical protein
MMTDEIKQQMATNAFELAELREQVYTQKQSIASVVVHRDELKTRLQTAANRAARIVQLCESAAYNGRTTVLIEDVMKILGYR